MMWKQVGRAALLAAAGVSLCAGVTSCTNTKLGYLFALSNENGGQIYSFRVDSESGSLKQLSNKSTTQNSPTSSGGADPTRLVLAGGGDFIYVLNAGDNSISLFTVGGDGTVFQQGAVFFSQGQVSQDIRLSGNGNFLLVADKYQPGLDIPTCEANAGTSNACDGDITVFKIDQTTGILSLVENVTPPGGGTTDLSYFPVGENPYRIYANASYVYTLDNSGNGNSRIFVYQANTDGTLTLTEDGGTAGAVTGPSPVAITSSANFLYVADSIQNVVYEYQIGSDGVPTVLVNASGTTTSNTCGATPTGTSYVSLGCNTLSPAGPVTGPTAMAIDPTNKYLYVSAAGSNTLVGYALESSGTNVGTLQPNVAYSSGSAPQCIAITGGREFLYTANFADGSVSGIQVDADTGQLKDATNNVKTAGQATCLVFDSNTD